MPGQDQWATTAIESATSFAEDWTNRQFVTASWQLTLDAFPCEIELPKPPLQSVTSIQYIDTAGDTQTLAASKYQVDATAEPGRVRPSFGNVWPSVRGDMNSITIIFVAGYGAASAVDERAKSAIKLTLAHWYENREPIITGTIVAEMPLSARSLLNQITVPGFA